MISWQHTPVDCFSLSHDPTPHYTGPPPAQQQAQMPAVQGPIATPTTTQPPPHLNTALVTSGSEVMGATSTPSSLSGKREVREAGNASCCSRKRWKERWWVVSSPSPSSRRPVIKVRCGVGVILVGFVSSCWVVLVAVVWFVWLWGWEIQQAGGVGASLCGFVGRGCSLLLFVVTVVVMGLVLVVRGLVLGHVVVWSWLQAARLRGAVINTA